eukprot:CAMPEP_0180703472 /NCGR_PEP_ID=MMETSP1038_2-20121128/6653_1 /TAXON_ID=632150 /ORGANISM="Azadinium spinosum, Strain 3D9" /LENGTH=144 /DNA_ID=CAMNT_0022735265 /DNA_START=465 /DNA_END=899 /DNA_ORIENTATION=-
MAEEHQPCKGREKKGGEDATKDTQRVRHRARTSRWLCQLHTGQLRCEEGDRGRCHEASSQLAESLKGATCRNGCFHKWQKEHRSRCKSAQDDPCTQAAALAEGCHLNGKTVTHPRCDTHDAEAGQERCKCAHYASVEEPCATEK